MAGSPRACAFATPNSGEPWTHIGTLKELQKKSNVEIMEEQYIRNQRILNSKRITLRDLER